MNQKLPGLAARSSGTQSCLHYRSETSNLQALTLPVPRGGGAPAKRPGQPACVELILALAKEGEGHSEYSEAASPTYREAEKRRGERGVRNSECGMERQAESREPKVVKRGSGDAGADAKRLRTCKVKYPTGATDRLLGDARPGRFLPGDQGR